MSDTIFWELGMGNWELEITLILCIFTYKYGLHSKSGCIPPKDRYNLDFSLTVEKPHAIFKKLARALIDGKLMGLDVPLIYNRDVPILPQGKRI